MFLQMRVLSASVHAVDSREVCPAVPSWRRLGVQLCSAPRGPGVPTEQLVRSAGRVASPLVDPAVTSGSSPA